MRRVFIVILSSAALLFAGWWFSYDDEEARARLVEKAARQSSTVALTAMLAEHEVFAFSDIVVGEAATPKNRDFRALVQRNGALRPAFGEAEYTCDELAGRPDCWHLAALEVDGIRLPLGPSKGAGGTPAGQSAAPTPASPKGSGVRTGIEAARADTYGPDGAEATAAEGLPPQPPPRPEQQPGQELASQDTRIASVETASDASRPVADRNLGRTHVVAVELANARSGPGTENSIRFTLSRDVPLHMLERDGRWGQFVVLDGSAAGETVWMAFSTITPDPAFDGN